MGRGHSCPLHVAYRLHCGDTQPWVPVPGVNGVESSHTYMGASSGSDFKGPND